MSLEIDGETLEALAMLGNSRRPMGYIEFVARPDRNLLASVLDLIDFGLVQRTEPHYQDGRRAPDEKESFYELSENGRQYFNSLINYVSETLTRKNTQ